MLVPLLVMALSAAIMFLAWESPARSDPDWTAPEIVDPGESVENIVPQIALDASGHPHVVWRGHDGGTRRVYYSTNPGDGWTTPANLSPGPNNNDLPQIALDASGHPHVVWSGNVGTSLIWYSTNPGSGWTYHANLSTSSQMNTNPQIALDASGHPHVVWRGWDGASFRIWYSTDPGGGWTAPVNLSPGTTANTNPQIALDASGHPHVVWEGSVGTNVLVFYSTNPGDGWTAPRNVSPVTPGTNSNHSPQIALDASGHPHVVWEGYEGTTHRIWYRTNPGGGWTDLVNISPGSTDNLDPQIVLDASDRPHVVWAGNDGTSFRTWYSTNPGGGWTAPVDLSPGSTDNFNPQIALDGDSSPHVVWSGEDDAAVSRIWYSTHTGGGWTAQVHLSLASGDCFDPQIVLDGEGNPKAVWSGYDGSTTFRIWYAEEMAYAFYFAEGYTGEGFREYLCLGQPVDAPLEVAVTCLFNDGTDPLVRNYTVPGLSRLTVDVNGVVGSGREVSIVCQAPSPFIAERPMYFDYRGVWTGGHDAVGAPSPSDVWYFAEGYTGEGFEEWVCVLNPGDEDAVLTLRFQTQEEGERTVAGLAVPARSRRSFLVNDLLGGGSYQTSLALESTRPVVAERPMYFSYLGTGRWGWTGGHCVMGVPELATAYSFAEGTTRAGFEEWLTLQNPGDAAITVSASYVLGEGAPVERTYEIAPRRRFTVPVFDPDQGVGPGKDVSVTLSSASPFLAERPMYFAYPGTGNWGWTGGHCVIGAPAAAQEWFFAEGYTGAGFEEWLCIQNPGDEEAQVAITYYPEEGGPIVRDPLPVPARTRHTVLVNRHAGPGLAISAEVVSDRPVIVERPMYFSYGPEGWTGGHDVVGFAP